MDLRVLKTKKNIREAFLELRKKYSLDEIKVNDGADIIATKEDDTRYEGKSDQKQNLYTFIFG